MNVTEAYDLAADAINNIGTHSLRKFAVATARMCGVSKDKINICRRSTSSARIQDMFADTIILYINGKVAAALCKDRPIAYLCCEGAVWRDGRLNPYPHHAKDNRGLPKEVGHRNLGE